MYVPNMHMYVPTYILAYICPPTVHIFVHVYLHNTQVHIYLVYNWSALSTSCWQRPLRQLGWTIQAAHGSTTEVPEIKCFLFPHLDRLHLIVGQARHSILAGQKSRQLTDDLFPSSGSCHRYRRAAGSGIDKARKLDMVSLGAWVLGAWVHES